MNPRTRPLDGIRVLEVGQLLAGPFAGSMLPYYGAEVIKVERPGPGDDYRHGPSKEGETSLSFQNANRGKRSIQLDMKTPAGSEIARFDDTTPARAIRFERDTSPLTCDD